MVDIHELTEKTAFANMGVAGEVVKAFEIPGIADTTNEILKLLEIIADHIGGTAPTTYDIQIWNITNADWWTNLDDDFDTTFFLETGISPSAPARRDNTDFGERWYSNKDTSGARNRIYVGIRLVGGDATTDMAITVKLKAGGN